MLRVMKARNEEEFADALGERIASIRKRKGFTQEGLAEAAELDRMTIALVETGKKRPSVTTIYKLAKYLGVEASDFFIDL
jgi:transcriptional regulator with XRE-family HTH domain